MMPNSLLAHCGSQSGLGQPFVSKFVCAQLIDTCVPTINLVVADFGIETCGVEVFPVTDLALCPLRSHNMPWQAKSGYVEHHRAAVKRTVNLYPLVWLLAPQSGEVFDSLDNCNRRLRLYAFAEGFNIIRHKCQARLG
jgi:hypothetical protein